MSRFRLDVFYHRVIYMTSKMPRSPQTGAPLHQLRSPHDLRITLALQTPAQRRMGDNKILKSSGIPSWQRAESSTGPNDQPQNSPQSSLQTPRDSLLAQAATFLLNEDVHNAPLERKRSFLQSKGLTIDEIDRLLQAPVNEKASNGTAETKNPIPEVTRIGI